MELTEYINFLLILFFVNIAFFTKEYFMRFLDATVKTKFRIQAFITAVIGIVWFFLISNNVRPSQIYTSQCYWYSKYHFFCPGCGGTRAFEQLIYGNIKESIIFHPVVFFVFFILIFSDITYLLHIYTKGKFSYYELGFKHLLYANLIFIVTWIFRNLLVLYFNFYIF